MLALQYQCSNSEAVSLWYQRPIPGRQLWSELPEDPRPPGLRGSACRTVTFARVRGTYLAVVAHAAAGFDAVAGGLRIACTDGVTSGSGWEAARPCRCAGHDPCLCTAFSRGLCNHRALSSTPAPEARIVFRSTSLSPQIRPLDDHVRIQSRTARLSSVHVSTLSRCSEHHPVLVQ